MMSKTAVWAILGGGNGGQSFAGHLALKGFKVRLYDIVPETINAITQAGGIALDGVIEGFGRLDLATKDIGEAIAGAEIIVIVAPATAHKAIAVAAAPHLSEGQMIIVHPGATGGALEIRQTIVAEGCQATIPVAETNTLIYACRARAPGHATIMGIKNDLVLATLPARDNPRVLAAFREAFPQTSAGRNVLETSLGNANAIMHPTPTLLNTSLIESRHEWLYYYDGITPSIGAFVEALDGERVQIGRSFGLELTPILAWYAKAYGVVAKTLSEAARDNPAYAGIKGQKSMRTRYLLEDVPMGLVPMIELGRLKGVRTDRMELVARFAAALLGEDFFATGRTLKNLGLDRLTPAGFDRLLADGT
jgi:opine dehydrogenase